MVELSKNRNFAENFIQGIMNYSFKVENDVLVVSLQGRLDTEASAKFEQEFAEITKANPHGSLVVDAS
jgi:anti-anti-sigma regulatory factor